MKPDIELHVEELVLHGFAPGDRHVIGKAVERELARQLAGRDMPQSLARGSEIERLDGGRFEVEPGSGAEAIGVQVAQAVYRRLGR